MRLLVVLYLLLTLPQLVWGNAVPDSIIAILHQKARLDPTWTIQTGDDLLASPDLTAAQRADLLLAMGTAQQARGALAEALVVTQEAFRIFDSLQLPKGKYAALNNLGTMQLSLNNLEAAAGYFEAVWQGQGASKSVQAYALANLATVQEQQGLYEKAISTHQQSIDMLEAIGEVGKLAIAYHNLAVCYGMMGNFALSEVHEQKALSHIEKHGGSDYQQSVVRLSLGSLYLETGRLNDAEVQLEKGGAAAKRMGNQAFVANYLENMANLKERKKDFAQALYFRKQLDSLRNEQYEVDKLAAEANAEKRFQADLARRELALLEAKAEKTEQLLWGSVLAGLLVLALLGLLFRNYQLKKRSEQLLSIENQLLTQENALARFETLRHQISPHFLFNTLNTLQALIGSDPVAAQRFVRAFSRIFRRVLEAGQQPLVPLSAELEQVEAYWQLQELRFGGQLQLIDRIDEEMRSLWLPPFALQMLIENAIKHNQISEQQPLLIELSNEGRWLKVTNAIQRQSTPTESTGTGLQNIKARYQLLGHDSPTFDNTGNFFIAKLPLVQP